MFIINQKSISKLISEDRRRLVSDGKSIIIEDASYADTLLVLNELKKIGFIAEGEPTKLETGYKVSIRREKERVIQFKSQFLQSFFEKDLGKKDFIQADLEKAYKHDNLMIIFSNNPEGTISNVLSQEDMDILTSIPTDLELQGFNLSGLNISRNFDDSEIDDLIKRIGSDPQSYDCENWKTRLSTDINRISPLCLRFTSCDMKNVSFSGKGYTNIAINRCDLDKDFLGKLKDIQKYVRSLSIINKDRLNDEGVEILMNERKTTSRSEGKVFKKPEEVYSVPLNEKKKEENWKMWQKLKKYLIKAPLDLTYLREFRALMTMMLNGFELSQKDLDSISQIKNLDKLYLDEVCDYTEGAVFTGGPSLKQLFVRDLPDMNILSADKLCENLDLLRIGFILNTEIKNKDRVRDYIGKIDFWTDRPACKALVKELKEMSLVQESEEPRNNSRLYKFDGKFMPLEQRTIKDALINKTDIEK